MDEAPPFNIIENLPPELIVMITEYLDLQKIFQLRRVSKLWHFIFSQRGVLNHILDPWFREGPDWGSAAQDWRTLTDSDLSSLCGQIDAFQTAVPFSRAERNCDVAWADPNSYGEVEDSFWDKWSKVAYCNGKLAWVNGSNVIALADIATAETKRVTWEDTSENVFCMAMSEEVLAVLTDSMEIHAYEIAVNRHHTKEVPSLGPISLSVAGGVIAILCEPPIDGQSLRIITWKVGDEDYEDFAVSLDILSKEKTENHKLIRLKKLLISPLNETVTVFHLELLASQINLYFGRFNLLGECQEQGKEELLIEENSMQMQDWDIATLRENFVELQKVIVYTNRPGNERDSACITYFDRKTQRLKLRDFPIGSDFVGGLKQCFVWKHIIYALCDWAEEDPPRYRMVQSKYYHGEVNMHDIPMNHFEPICDFRRNKELDDEEYDDECERFYENNAWNYLMLGDERYLIKISEDNYIAYCFDKKVQMVGEDQIYKAKRSKLLKKTRRWKDSLAQPRIWRTLLNGEVEEVDQSENTYGYEPEHDPNRLRSSIKLYDRTKLALR